jgi:hypothetical protein
MHTIKRILTSTILAIGIATLATGPALADTPPSPREGQEVAEWIFSPSTISVVPAQGAVVIASATFTTSRSNFEFWGGSTTSTWFFDAEASTTFQAQSSSTSSCIINIAIPGAVPSTGAGVPGVVTPNFALGDLSTATARIVGYQLYPSTTYTATATISASGAGCNEGSNPLVKFTLKMRVAP